MSRSVPTWHGKTDNTPPPPRVKARIVTHQDGRCACGCGMKLGVAGERIDFDHITALILGGKNSEDNLQALRQPCHALKTKADVAQKAKESRVRQKHLGLSKPARKMPYRRFNGEIVWPE